MQLLNAAHNCSGLAFSLFVSVFHCEMTLECCRVLCNVDWFCEVRSRKWGLECIWRDGFLWWWLRVETWEWVRDFCECQLGKWKSLFSLRCHCLLTKPNCNFWFWFGIECWICSLPFSPFLWLRGHPFTWSDLLFELILPSFASMCSASIILSLSHLHELMLSY